ALTFQNHTDCPLTDFGGKTSIFSHPVYLFLRKFSLQDSRGGSHRMGMRQQPVDAPLCPHVQIVLCAISLRSD
ncbi:hypothetical protein, partial [Escherichia albertii]|uniref:hypothetical protein n=1 Tax=Escherichia albertii TaxID=208962 RepID=UPI001A7E0D06